MEELGDLEATWHFIGRLQTNKARDVAERFHWVHAVDRTRLAAALSKARPESLPPLDVCIQVNISAEASKGGVAPGEALALAREVHGLPRLRLRGLMGMASATARALRAAGAVRAARAHAGRRSARRASRSTRFPWA